MKRYKCLISQDYIRIFRLSTEQLMLGSCVWIDIFFH